MRSLGIMQGRLSAPAPGAIQTFPWRSWEAEFGNAARCGLDAIEWLVADEGATNPIFTLEGRRRMRTQVTSRGIAVPSVCAHYFVAHPLSDRDPCRRVASAHLLEDLLRAAHDGGIQTILVPALEQASVAREGRQELIDTLAGPIGLAESLGVTLGLESDLSPTEAAALVDHVGSRSLGIYFDIGNSVAAGGSPAAEIRTLGRRICGVHVKDRTVGGPSVRLGTGDADIAGALHALDVVGYAGPLILEGQTGDDFIERAIAYTALVRQLGSASRASAT